MAGRGRVISVHTIHTNTYNTVRKRTARDDDDDDLSEKINNNNNNNNNDNGRPGDRDHTHTRN